jgi:hypothetical protein
LGFRAANSASRTEQLTGDLASDGDEWTRGRWRDLQIRRANEENARTGIAVPMRATGTAVKPIMSPNEGRHDYQPSDKE